jgi:hypothetical protein
MQRYFFSLKEIIHLPIYLYYFSLSLTLWPCHHEESRTDATLGITRVNVNIELLRPKTTFQPLLEVSSPTNKSAEVDYSLNEFSAI